MSRDDKWHVVVKNPDGSVRAHGKFRWRWAARVAIEMALLLRTGETLTVSAPATTPADGEGT